LRRFLFLLFLCIVLAATIALNRNLSAWFYVVPSEPGKLLYIATFDGFLEDWELFEGRLSAQVIDSKLRIEVGAVNSLPYAPTRIYFSDFDLTVNATPVEGPLNNGYGVVFRLRDPKNFYMFLISSDGYYQVQQQVDGVTEIISDWIPSDLVKQGLAVTNQLRVVAQGANFQFHINGELVELCIPDNPEAKSTYFDGECLDGQMVETLTDPAFTVGRFGVIAESFDEIGVVVDFDNLIVYGPEAIKK
jgi:hypothetical protein